LEHLASRIKPNKMLLGQVF